MTNPSATPGPDERPSRRRGRWLIGLSVCLLLIVAGVVFRIVSERQRILKRLEETLAELDRTDPGWRIEEIEAARASLRDVDDSAFCVLATGKRLPRGWLPRTMPALESLPANERLSEEEVRKVETELSSCRAALVEGRRLADKENGHYAIRYAKDIVSTLLPHTDDIRSVTSLLVLDAALRLHMGDRHGAAVSCRVAINAGRSIGDEPLAISQLIRFGCVGVACRSVERLLGQCEPLPEDLVSLQRLLEKEAAAPLWAIAMRGERACQHHLLESLESGAIPLTEEHLDKPSWRDRLLGRRAIDRLREEHARMFPLANRLVEIAPLAPHLRAGPQAKVEADLDTKFSVATVLLLSLGKIERADRRRQARLRCLVATLAAERCRHEQKGWPASLEVLKRLVPVSLLVDPCDGNPLRYRRLEDGVVIYSIGLDGHDDGGNLDGMPDEVGTDIGIRLWDTSKRAQPPTKRPVPEEEP